MAVIHVGLGYALLSGLGVDIVPRVEPVLQMVEVGLVPPPPQQQAPPQPPQPRKQAAASGSTPRAPTPAPPGGSPGPVERAAPPVPAAPIILNPVAAGGGSTGTGASIGAGSGGGTGGVGSGSGLGDGDGPGDGDGGSDIEQIAGEIRRSDAPRAAREAGLGGQVIFTFVVGIDGRVSGCAVTRSSGVTALDEATCRIVTKRFRYRPATDRYGRPVPTRVDGEHVWESWRD